MDRHGLIVWNAGRGPGGGAVSSPIIWNTRDPLGGLEPAEFEAALRRRLAGRVEEAWVFGSYGTRAFGPDSDVDIFIVQRTAKPFFERAIEFSDIMELVPAMDILVYTPEEFRSLTEDPSPGFWRSAVASMSRIV
jgi:predicted nucleotidyltransferase